MSFYLNTRIGHLPLTLKVNMTSNRQAGSLQMHRFVQEHYLVWFRKTSLFHISFVTSVMNVNMLIKLKYSFKITHHWLLLKHWTLKAVSWVKVWFLFHPSNPSPADIVALYITSPDFLLYCRNNYYSHLWTSLCFKWVVMNCFHCWPDLVVFFDEVGLDYPFGPVTVITMLSCSETNTREQRKSECLFQHT